MFFPSGPSLSFSAFPSAPLVCCTISLLVIYVLRVLSHKHQVYAELFPRLPKVCCTLVLYFAFFSNFFLLLLCLTNIGWSKGGAVVRALASHQYAPGWNPGFDSICWLSLLLVLSFAPRGFSPGTLVFPSPQKPTLPNSNSIWNAWTRLNEFIWTLKCFVGKKAIYIYLFYIFYIFPSAPVKSATSFCYALVINLFCVFCLTNIGFMQCFSLGTRKVCCTPLLNLFYYVIFCFACFASQTSGFWSAFPSAPVKSVTRFCYALVRTLFCVFCLTNTGFVQCYSLGSRKVCCMLVFTLLYSVIFCFACFASQTSCFVQCSSFGSRSLLHAFVVSNLCLVLFASPTSALCSAFPFGSPQVYTLLFFFVLFSLLLLCAQQAPVCAVIFPGSLRSCALNFLLCIIQF